MRTRLTLPMRFANEKRALGVIRDNSLFTIGALAVAVDGTGLGWRVVIDTGKPDAVCRYLGQYMPGVEWTRSQTL
jgi:hypothetical protein